MGDIYVSVNNYTNEFTHITSRDLKAGLLFTEQNKNSKWESVPRHRNLEVECSFREVLNESIRGFFLFRGFPPFHIESYFVPKFICSELKTILPRKEIKNSDILKNKYFNISCSEKFHTQEKRWRSIEEKESKCKFWNMFLKIQLQQVIRFCEKFFRVIISWSKVNF